MTKFVGRTMDGLVAGDGDRFYLVQDERCSCDVADCPHVRLPLPEFLHYFQRRAVGPDPCPDCGTPLRVYRNELASITLCPQCGHGVRRRIRWAKSSLHRRRGRRARTAVRYLPAE